MPTLIETFPVSDTDHVWGVINDLNTLSRACPGRASRRRRAPSPSGPRSQSGWAPWACCSAGRSLESSDVASRTIKVKAMTREAGGHLLRSRLRLGTINRVSRSSTAIAAMHVQLAGRARLIVPAHVRPGVATLQRRQGDDARGRRPEPRLGRHHDLARRRRRDDQRGRAHQRQGGHARRGHDDGRPAFSSSRRASPRTSATPEPGPQLLQNDSSPSLRVDSRTPRRIAASPTGSSCRRSPSAASRRTSAR